VGITGSKAKCELLTSEFGFNAALDYKAGGLMRQLAEATAGGIDVFFDNVGGEVFEAALFNMSRAGAWSRVALSRPTTLIFRKGYQACVAYPRGSFRGACRCGASSCRTSTISVIEP
jgi:NADPH:quinone reductase-like Zn-dependent oxidoreductase